MFASKPQLAGALLKRAHSRGIRAAVARWRIEEDHQLAKQVAGLDAGQVIRWKSWHRWTSICLLAYIYLAIAAALQRQHDTGAELAELIPITAGTATASAWHGHPATPARPGHRLHWSTWRRHHQHRARQAHQRWNAYAETAA